MQGAPGQQGDGHTSIVGATLATPMAATAMAAARRGEANSLNRPRPAGQLRGSGALVGWGSEQGYGLRSETVPTG